jgi:hypothetical protein
MTRPRGIRPGDVSRSQVPCRSLEELGPASRHAPALSVLLIVQLPGSTMGDLQTFFWIFVEGIAGLSLVLVLVLLACRELVRMWRSGEDRLVFCIASGAVFVFLAFTVLTTYGVTYGALHYHAP